MKLKACIISVILLVYTNLCGQTDPEIVLDKKLIGSLDYNLINFGDQKKIKSEPVELDVGYGKNKGLIFRLPNIDTNETKLFRFSSRVRGNSLYYPIFLKLNENLDLIEIVKEKIDLKGGLYSLEHQTDVSIGNSVKYILITTDSSLFSKDFNHTVQSTQLTPIYSGSTVITVPTRGGAINRNITFSDKPRLKVLAPTVNRFDPYKREKGIYFGFGMSFGGEKVADNPSGDDYRAGGGAMFNIGYSSILFSSNLVTRYGIGFRYQGSKDGDARNRGFFGELALTYQFKHINFGLGSHMDVSNSIRNLSDTEFEFKNSLAPKFIVEYRINGMVNMGLEYVVTDHEIQNGDQYSGNRVHLTMKFFPSS